MKTKKLLAALMAITFIGGAMTVSPQTVRDYSLTASAEDYTEDTYENLTYRKYTDHIEISRCDRNAESVVIPSKIENLPVTGIRAGAFSLCRSLESLTIPDSVTDIVANSFENTPWLKNKQEENPLVIINNMLINGTACTGDVIIPDGVTSIESLAFDRCKSLSSITIPDSVSRIKTFAFESCTNLSSVTLSSGVKSIEIGAFFDCDSLESITIPDSVTLIDSSAFGLCNSLSSITILNPNCDIYDSEFTIYGYDDTDNEGNTYSTFNGTIYGYKNSTAQAYAEKYERTFKPLDELPDEPEYKLGDPNADGLIDAVDASYILALYAKISTSDETPTEFEWLTCDVNKDGLIDAVDASAVLAYYAHVSTDGELSFEEFMEQT